MRGEENPRVLGELRNSEFCCYTDTVAVVDVIKNLVLDFGLYYCIYIRDSIVIFTSGGSHVK